MKRWNLSKWGAALVALFFITAGAAAFIAQGLWFPNVMIVERNPAEIHPPRWDLTVHPGGIEHEFLTADRLAQLVHFYSSGISSKSEAEGR